MHTRGGMLCRIPPYAEASAGKAPPRVRRHAPPAARETHDGHARAAGVVSSLPSEHDAQDEPSGMGLLPDRETHDGHARAAGVVSSLPSEHDAQDVHGVTPLLEAVMHNNLPRVRQLLHARASPNAPDSAGQSPLLVAVRGHRLPIARALVEAGAGEGAWHKLLPHAARTQALSLVQLVLRAGCDYMLPEAPSESACPLVEAAVRERWLAVLMSLHARLGGAAECGMRVLPPELLQHLCLHWLHPAWLRARANAVG